MLVVFIRRGFKANSTHSGDTTPDDVSIYSCEYIPYMLHMYIYFNTFWLRDNH